MTEAKVLAGAEADEYQRLYAEHAEAIARALMALKVEGMGSAEFQEADAAAGRCWVRLREFLGEGGKDWMA